MSLFYHWWWFPAFLALIGFIASLAPKLPEDDWNPEMPSPWNVIGWFCLFSACLVALGHFL